MSRDYFGSSVCMSECIVSNISNEVRIKMTGSLFTITQILWLHHLGEVEMVNYPIKTTLT